MSLNLTAIARDALQRNRGNTANKATTTIATLDAKSPVYISD
jgi:hypothetical protein